MILGRRRLTRREELQYWRQARKWQVAYWTKLNILKEELHRRRENKNFIKGLGKAFANYIMAGT